MEITIVSIIAIVLPIILAGIGMLRLQKYKKYACVAVLAERAFWKVEEAADELDMNSASKLAMALKEIAGALGRSMAGEEVTEATKLLKAKAKAAKVLKEVHPLQK